MINIHSPGLFPTEKRKAPPLRLPPYGSRWGYSTETLCGDLDPGRPGRVELPLPAWFSQGFNLGQLRTTWMQESKLTPVFKGEEKQGLDIINFNQSQLHLPGRLCRTGIFLLTVLPRQVTDGVFKAPGGGTARLSSCFPLSGESCLRPKYHTYISVLFYLQHRDCTLIFGYLSQQ